MKKTVISQLIDGHNIVTGFDRPTVDAVETAKIVNEAIKDTSEYQALEAKKAEYAAAIKELGTLQGKYKKGAKVSSDDQNQWNTLSGKASIYQDELKPLAIEFDKKIIDLRRSKAVYFEPRAGEVIKDASEIEKLIKAIKGKPKGSLVTLEGDTVEDNRGQVFFRKSGGKWGYTQIIKLGDKIPGDAVTEPTDTQMNEINKDRVSTLTDTERAAERELAMTDAINKAASIRNELEIKSDPDALKKSQAAYKSEVKRIEVLYG